MSKTKVVSFDKATNSQLQSAAKFCGLDEVNPKFMDAIEAKRLDPAMRPKMIKQMKSMGYTAVDVTNRHFIMATHPEIK